MFSLFSYSQLYGESETIAIQSYTMPASFQVAKLFQNRDHRKNFV